MTPCGPLKKVLLFSASGLMLGCPVFGQSSQVIWPQTQLSACPSSVPQETSRQKAWKHGQAERNDFQVAVEAGKKGDWRLLAATLQTFVNRYPDSDYRDVALALEAATYLKLKDTAGQVSVAEQMISLPSATANIRLLGLVTLCDSLPQFVSPSDAQLDRKLADVSRWVECGRAAFSAAGPPPTGTRDVTESILDGTEGFVSLRRRNYNQASESLIKAVQENPKNALAYLWLVEAKTFEPATDTKTMEEKNTAAVFYMARFTDLRPQIPQAEKLLEKIYKLEHGSKKGLKELKALAQTDATPPAGFTILPKAEKKNHYAAGIAAAALIGLLVYGEVATHGELLSGEDSGNGSSGGEPSTKIMIFGGPGHGTYLGCLSCGEFAADSVFNRAGENGSSFAADSVWNHYGNYGSPYSSYSACNQDATDPPVIVDGNGKAYGRLTVNRYAPDIGAGMHLYGWLSSTVCGIP